MSLISLFVNGIELDYIKETLNIKKENQLLGGDIKFTHNSYPFLIIENEKSEQALGKNHLQSVQSQYYEITVITLEGKFVGELQVLECMTNYRKCNIRYNSKIYSLEKINIRELFPTLSVIGENPPRPYEKQIDEMLPSNVNAEWKSYVSRFDEKEFPDVLWQFPMVYFPDKFGEIKEGDDWELYNRHLNTRIFIGGNVIETNSIVTTSEGVEVQNRNVITPFPYLLAPLLLACEQTGLTLDGSIFQDDFIKSILIYSPEDNLSEISDIDDKVLVPLFDQIPETYNDILYSFRRMFTVTLAVGTYSFTYDIEYANNRHYLRVRTSEKTSDLFAKNVGNALERFSGSFEVKITPRDVELNRNLVEFFCYSAFAAEPTVKDLSYVKKLVKKGSVFHPTLDVPRFIPDWTFGEYLNQLKKLFNLRFEENADENVLKVIYNDRNILIKDFFDLGSIRVNSYSKINHSHIALQYDNDEDDILKVNPNVTYSYVDKIDEEKTLSIKNKFKQLNYKNGELLLSAFDDKKSGIGLVLYKPNFFNQTSQEVDGSKLDLEGIYQRYFTNTSRIYLNPNRIEVEKKVTKFELIELLNKKRVLVNNQPYYIDQSSYSEKSTLIDVKLNLIPL